MKYLVKRPHITEKTLNLAQKGWYTFVVDTHAQKKHIAAAIARLYGVTVTQVRTITTHGKVRRSGRRQTPMEKSDWKKALVQLAKGEKIDAFEMPTQEGK